MQELRDAIPSLANAKAVGPDGVSVELFKIILNDDPTLRRRPLDIVVRIWRGGELPQQWKYAISMVFHKTKDRTECGNYRVILLVVLRKASEARVNRRRRRYYLIVLLLPKTPTLACLPLSSI